VEPPCDDEALARDFVTSWFVYVAAAVAAAQRVFGVGDSGFEDDTLVLAALGRTTSGVELSDAIDRRHLYIRALADFHAEHALLLTPTLARPPLLVGELNTPPPLVAVSRLLLRTHTAGLLSRIGLTDQLVSKNLSWVALHAAGQRHRPPGGQRPVALDVGGAAARGAVRRTSGQRGPAAAAGGPARAGAAVGRSPPRRGRPAICRDAYAMMSAWAMA